MNRLWHRVANSVLCVIALSMGWAFQAQADWPAGGVVMRTSLLGG
jgi:hypothetical protein